MRGWQKQEHEQGHEQEHEQEQRRAVRRRGADAGITRRGFVGLAAGGLAAAVGGRAAAAEPLFRISLAQWSLHKTIFSGKLDNLDFPRTAKETSGSRRSNT